MRPKIQFTMLKIGQIFTVSLRMQITGHEDQKQEDYQISVHAD